MLAGQPDCLDAGKAVSASSASLENDINPSSMAQTCPENRIFSTTHIVGSCMASLALLQQLPAGMTTVGLGWLSDP